MRIHAALATILCLSAAATSGASAQESVAAFYKGRTMTILAGSSAGGGVDVYARLVGRHLGKHIPGNPNIIVQNMPGEGSLAAARNLYAIAPKDGTQIGVILSSALFDPLMSGQDLQAYDPRTFNYLGNANADTSVCVVRKDAPVQSYADLAEKELVVGGTGPGSALVDYPVMERYLLGSKLKLISGYKGSNEISIAIERNEVQGICGLLWSSAKQQYPQALRPDGNVKILVQEDTKSHPALASLKVPLVTAFARTPEQKRALDVFLEQGSISRPFMAPPGVPADRIAALRKAFMETMQDPELQAEASKQGLDTVPNTGAEVQALVNSVYVTPPELIATLRKATEGVH